MTGPEMLISAADALPGRDEPIECGSHHALWDRALRPAYDQARRALIDGESVEELIVGMGCFWGAERLFWNLEGVALTAVGYAGGHTPNPTYREVCSGLTGHTEVVLIHFDPARVRIQALLKLFWERHDPTQGMRQGNDIGTQYRSALYWTTPEQERAVRESMALYQELLSAGQAPGAAGDHVTTELKPAPIFYYAEEYHQQYLHKNPNGYCGLRGTGAVCPI